jgi:hypothetical protein
MLDKLITGAVASRTIEFMQRTCRLLVRQRTMSAAAFRFGADGVWYCCSAGAEAVRHLMLVLEDPTSAIRHERACRYSCWLGNGKGRSFAAPRPTKLRAWLMGMPGWVCSGQPRSRPQYRVSKCSKQRGTLQLG